MHQKRRPSQEAHDCSLLPDLVRLQSVEHNNDPVNREQTVNHLLSAWTLGGKKEQKILSVGVIWYIIKWE